MTKHHDGDDGNNHDDDHRTVENLIVIIVIVVLIVAGVWLIERIIEGDRIERCLEAGHRNCVPLNTVAPVTEGS
jgi:hypothetical protein